MNNIYLIGDSTCQSNDETTFPQKGWGQYLYTILKDEYNVINVARNGRSSKSFIDEGWFKVIEDNISKGDYLFIEFGHNDEKADEGRHTDPYNGYQKNLKFFIDSAKKAGATPILLSSISRRKYENGVIVPTHGDYPKAMEELAKKENVPFIDMDKLTRERLNKMSEKETRELFMNFDKGIYPNYMEGKEDNTHQREKGCLFLVSIIKEELNKIESFKNLLK